MSRLDKFITRMQVQRRLLDEACEEIRANAKGPELVVEFGLGNGRTYDHLRERLPGHRVVVFDREVKAHRAPASADDLVVGEIDQTAPAFGARHGAIAAFVHADLGNGREDYDDVLGRLLPPAILAVARPGARVLSSTPFSNPRLSPLPYPDDAPGYEYFLYRVLPA